MPFLFQFKSYQFLQTYLEYYFFHEALSTPSKEAALSFSTRRQILLILLDDKMH
jgi:hypothetical protein